MLNRSLSEFTIGGCCRIRFSWEMSEVGDVCRVDERESSPKDLAFSGDEIIPGREVKA